MKTTFALSALISSVLAAPFQLVISPSSSEVPEVQEGNAIVFQHNELFIASAGRHGVNFVAGDDGTLTIQNGTPVYIDITGQFMLQEYQQEIPSDGLTEGFIVGSGDAFAWAQGNTYACLTDMEFEWGAPAQAWGLFAERPGVQLPEGCVEVTLKTAAI